MLFHELVSRATLQSACSVIDNGLTPAPYLQGLEELKMLKDLNLAANKITVIGKSLGHMSRLETLNLSGNMISSLTVSMTEVYLLFRDISMIL